MANASGLARGVKPLTRPALIAAVRGALEPRASVHCLWEGGSTCFARSDQRSDVDLQCEVDDDQVAATFAAVEAALAAVAETNLCFVVPEPAWHGHSQRFYRFANAEPWLQLDLCVMKRSSPSKFNEPDIHGPAAVLFDRSGLFGKHVVRTDRAAFETKLRGRIEALPVRFAMFQVLVEKETWRGNAIDALYFYQSLTLAPLVELLRIRHDPLRHNWGYRYLHRTLPGADAARLQRLLYVAAPGEIPAKRTEAAAWFEELRAALTAQTRLVPAE